jgi:propionyl-CoA carboxylase beta chain
MAVAKDYLTPTKNFFSSVAQVEQPLDHHPCIMKEKFKKRLKQEREHALMGGGAKRIARQHEKGSLTARERIELLFDKGMMPILKDME